MKWKICYWAISHAGKIRVMNQDNLACAGSWMPPDEKQTQFCLTGEQPADRFPLFGVFDGLGGEQCGDIAARIAAVRAKNLRCDADMKQQLLTFCQKANLDICKYAQEHQVRAMGTTAAMVSFGPAGAAVCNIGDSKVFRISNGKLEQLSEDHLGLAPYGVKPPLLQKLGMPPEKTRLEPHITEEKYHKDALYLLCSDGLTDMVEQDKIAEILETLRPAQAAKELVKKALDAGGRDNITLILCKPERYFGWCGK